VRRAKSLASDGVARGSLSASDAFPHQEAMAMQRPRNRYTGEPLPLWRAELPFILLGAAALASPVAVLGQGGDWHTAILAACVVLGAPGAAVESVIGAARLAVLLRGR
jgi:hypothetical protein